MVEREIQSDGLEQIVARAKEQFGIGPSLPQEVIAFINKHKDERLTPKQKGELFRLMASGKGTGKKHCGEVYGRKRKEPDTRTRRWSHVSKNHPRGAPWKIDK